MAWPDFKSRACATGSASVSPAGRRPHSQPRARPLGPGNATRWPSTAERANASPDELLARWAGKPQLMLPVPQGVALGLDELLGLRPKTRARCPEQPSSEGAQAVTAQGAAMGERHGHDGFQSPERTQALRRRPAWTRRHAAPSGLRDRRASLSQGCAPGLLARSFGA